MQCLTHQSALKIHAGCDYNTPGLPKPLKASLFNDLLYFYEHFRKIEIPKIIFNFFKIRRRTRRSLLYGSRPLKPHI